MEQGGRGGSRHLHEQVQVGRDMVTLLQASEKEAMKRNDQFVASELFLLALADSKAEIGNVARTNGLTRKSLESAIDAVRGGAIGDAVYFAATFGFQTSVEGSGYTWSCNSRENQITPWSNDPVTDRSGEAFYLRDDDTGVRMVHVHLYVMPAAAWQEKLAFRDALRADPELAAAYATEKYRVAESVAWDKSAYALAKGPFVQRVLATLSPLED